MYVRSASSRTNQLHPTTINSTVHHIRRTRERELAHQNDAVHIRITSGMKDRAQEKMLQGYPTGQNLKVQTCEQA